jgi:4-amino-4-deoxy-L-arabinose transferase-like glycosyltransferase
MTAARLSSGRRRLAALGLLVLLALILRLAWLDASPLRGDEAFAIQYWAAPWPEALNLTGVEPHPLGTFGLFALWKAIFGDGEWVMRLLPTLLSLPGLAAIYTLGRLLFRGQRVALLAALLYAVHPFLIWHAQDVRNYAIWTSTELLALAALVIALRRDRWRDWLLYGLATTLSAYIFFFAALFWPVHALIVVMWRPRRWKNFLRTLPLIGLLLIPWAVQLTALARSGYGGTAGAFEPAQLLTWFLPVLAMGETLPPDLLAMLWIVLLPLLFLALGVIWRANPRTGQILALMLIVPTVMLGLVSLKMDVFRPRYIVPLSGVVILLLAGLIIDLTTRRKLLKGLAGLGLAALLILDGWAVVNSHVDPAFRKAPDWRSLGAFLNTIVQPGDLVVQQALDPAFTYYLRADVDETTLPPPESDPVIRREETKHALSEALPTHRAIWLLPAELPGYDPEHLPLTWLEAHAQPTADLTMAGFRVLEYRPWQVSTQEYTPRLDLTFGDTACLLDYRVDRLGPDILRVTLYWQVLEASTVPLSGFVHLVGPPRPDGGPIWTQVDHRLVASKGVDTTVWQPDQIMRDVYLLALPADLPQSDAFALNLGLYDPASSTRWSIQPGGADHVDIPLGADLLPTAEAAS